MFDSYSQKLFEKIEGINELSSDDARRMLSQTYLAIMEQKLGKSDSSEASKQAMQFLRRLSNTIEFHILFNEESGEEITQAAAFIAAEALALMADFHEHQENDETSICCLRLNDTFIRFEAAILYLIARYDACASGIINRIPDTPMESDSKTDLAAKYCQSVLEALCTFKLNPMPPIECPINFGIGDNMEPTKYEDDTLARLYGLLGEGVAIFLYWLVGDTQDGNVRSEAILKNISNALTIQTNPTSFSLSGGDYGKIQHLAVLLRLCIKHLSDRALLQVVPDSKGFTHEFYDSYLKSRAKGAKAGSIGRPILWPSAFEYVKDCISGTNHHAVVSMPTGSGKSFVAELAISQSIGQGWSLYLAPTNALTDQIKSDLSRALRPLGSEVLSFVGDQEYSLLKTNIVAEMPTNSIAVMTPEKASLAIRLYPEVFTTCRLVVFDECHLLGEGSSGRGVTAELVLTQLMIRAPDIRLLLMSAMVQNPVDLSSWMAVVTNTSATSITIPWRPTRTLRTAVGVDKESYTSNREPANKTLEKLPNHRKHLDFGAQYSLVCGLQGAWQTKAISDYGLVKINCNADLKLSRKKLSNDTWSFSATSNSWVNSTVRRISTFLADHDIQTLAFTPASKHHPFSNAEGVNLSEDTLSSLSQLPAFIDTCQLLAEYEYGQESDVFRLIRKGVSVHTSHMIETEKIGSEFAFKRNSTRIMFATGTLAQGLNLPATAVVIGGTKIGDPRGQDPEIVKQRTRSQLINATGRAGRAGFANQGIVFAIPDKPLLIHNFDSVHSLRNQLDYLQHSDNSVVVNSGLTSFLDGVSHGILNQESASEVELQTFSIISGGDENQPKPENILANSFASYQRGAIGLSDISNEAAQYLEDIRINFIHQAQVPEWVPLAAQKAGLSFFLTLALENSWSSLRESIEPDIVDWSVEAWTHELIDVVSKLPPAILLRVCNLDKLSRGSAKFKLFEKNYSLQSLTDPDWEQPAEWVEGWIEIRGLLLLWMRGESIKAIAAQLINQPLEIITPKRSAGGQPIPKAIALINSLFSTLSIIAGGMVAIAEQRILHRKAEDNNVHQFVVPFALNCVPMCIRYGCNSPASLSWFRFGIRLRRPAHLLQQIFPPPNIESDEELRDWVHFQRAQWLAGESEIPPGLSAEKMNLLDNIASFINRN
jgi:superfamily II DNA/RNA helicase